MASAAPTLGSVDVDVGANLEKLLRGFRDAELAADRFDKALERRVQQSANNAQRASEALGRAQDRLGTSMDRSANSAQRFGRDVAAAGNEAVAAARKTDTAMQGLRNTLMSSAAVIVGALGVNELKNTADAYTRFTNQLKVAGLAGTQLAGTQDQLFQSAQRYGVELESLGTLYGRLAQSQNELGATSQQMMRFTNGVAAAIKVQGAGTEQVRGALLQLSQAMGSTIVRAEEFNSINEGARPILVAVANGIDKYGGSVSKLRTDVINGKLTSQEFFQGFLRGSAQLEAQATQANLTIGASFQVLNNALGRYIGQADQSLSATQKISAGIAALARNLDTIIPILTAIILAMGAKYVAAAGRMIATTALVEAAVFAMQARMAGAATTAEALAFAGTAAGRALLAAFGGPVGVAILAVAGAVYLYHQRAAAAQAETDRFNRMMKESAAVLETERAKAAAAHGEIKKLGSTQAGAVGGIRAFAGATGDAAKALWDQANAARAARLAIIDKQLQEAKDVRSAASKAYADAGQSPQSVARFGYLPGAGNPQYGPNAAQSEQQRRYNEADRRVKELEAARANAARDPLESYVPNARTQGRDIAAEIVQLQGQLVAAQRAGLQEQQREILKQIKIRKRITELMTQGLNFEIANAQAETEAMPAAGSGPETGSTRFGRPVRGGTIRGTVGERRPGHTHAGTDYAVPVGTPVSATAGGTVIETGTLPGYGNVIIIDHGRGMTTRYAHLSKIGVAKGQRVESGDQIGLSGGARGAPGAGNSQGPHLHYEVRKGGKPVDPNGLYATDEVEAANKAEQIAQKILQQEQAFGSSQQQMRDGILAANESQLIDEEAIAKVARDRVNGERDRERDEIKIKVQREEYTAAQGEILLALNEQLRAAELAALAFKEGQRKEEAANRVRDQIEDRKMEQLQAERDLARTASERRAIERRIIAAQKEYERQVLQATIDSPYAKPEEKDRARRDMSTLDRRYGNQTARLDRDALDEMMSGSPRDSQWGIRDEQEGVRRDRDDKIGTVDEVTEARLRDEKLTQEERERILKEAADRRVAIEMEAAQKILDLETKRKTLLLSNEQSIAEGLADIAAGIAGKQSALYRGLFATAKAFAIAQASIALYQNVAEAMKYGFPQNLPFIAAAIAQGATIMSNIQAISGSFAGGGWTGYGARNEIAGAVHGQEFVVKAGPAAKYRATLDSMNAGRDPTAGLRQAANDRGGLMSPGSRPMNVQLQNFAPGVRHEVEQLSEDRIRIIAREEAPKAVAADLDRPNSRTRKAVQRNTTARGRKS